MFQIARCCRFPAVLPTGQEVRGAVPDDFHGAVRNDTSPGDEQTAQRVQVLLAPALHRRHIVGGKV